MALYLNQLERLQNTYPIYIFINIMYRDVCVLEKVNEGLSGSQKKDSLCLIIVLFFLRRLLLMLDQFYFFEFIILPP